MNYNKLAAGDYTKKEYETVRALVYGFHAVMQEKKRFLRGPITKTEVEYIVKCLEAPDVNLFVRLV